MKIFSLMSLTMGPPISFLFKFIPIVYAVYAHSEYVGLERSYGLRTALSTRYTKYKNVSFEISASGTNF